jgi:photosynthetic reaction center cytochrome c subunit
MKTVFLVALCAGALAAQTVETAEAKFKNIQVFKGQPAADLIPLMSLMSGSLGVSCGFCHNMEKFESDEKKEKETARKMVTMTLAINETQFAGKQVVSCNTCHNGSEHPHRVPSIANAAYNHAPEPATKPTLPSPADIEAKFASALGDKDALEKLKSRVITGEAVPNRGPSGPFQLTLTDEEPKLDSKMRLPPQALRSLAEIFQISQHISHPPDPSKYRVRGIEDVRGHQAYVMDVNPQGSPVDRFYVDTSTGLMLRHHRETKTLLGMLPEEYDYDDYRAVNGVKTPYSVTWSRPDTRIVFKLTEVK